MYVYCDQNRAELPATNDADDAEKEIFPFVEVDDGKWTLLAQNIFCIILLIICLFLGLVVNFASDENEPDIVPFWNLKARITQTWYFYLLCLLNVGAMRFAFWWGYSTILSPRSGEKEDSRENLLECIRESLDTYILVLTPVTSCLVGLKRNSEQEKILREFEKRFTYQTFVCYLANPATSFGVLSRCGWYSKYNALLFILVNQTSSLVFFHFVYLIVHCNSLWAVLIWIGWVVYTGIIIWVYISIQLLVGWHWKLAGFAKKIRRECLKVGSLNLEDLEMGGNIYQRESAKERLKEWMWNILKDDTDSEQEAIKRRAKELVPLVEKIVL